MMKTDVLVIGGGAAGAMAATTAARSGFDTTLVRQGYGATALSTGAVDLSEVAEWLRGIVTNAEMIHPTVDTVVADFLGLMAEANYAYVGSQDKDLILINAMGTVKSTHLVPETMAAGDLESIEGARLLFVGVQGYPDFDATYLSKSLRFLSDCGLVRTCFETASLEIEFPRVVHTANLSSFELAQLMDDEEVVLEMAKCVQEKADLNQYTHLALPPILGRDNSARALAILQDQTALCCFEVLSLPPSVPGFRMQRALDRAMKHRDVRIIHASVESFSESKGGIRSVRVVEKETEYVLDPGVVILASGKFIGGGIQRTDRLREPIFDLPVFVDSDCAPDAEMGTLLAERFVSEQRIFKAGLQVDERFHPVSPDGQVIYSNLLAAGAVLAGYDYSLGQGGLGVSMVSGHLCAQVALDQLGGKGVFV